FRSVLFVPMVRDGASIGVIGVSRTVVGAFPENQVELLKAFADQAVIAIENVRLFKELEARNSELTTALDRQTATSEILRVISSSPTDTHPVLDTMVQSAARLCEAYDAVLVFRDGAELVTRTHWGPIAAPLDRRPLTHNTVMGRAILEARPIHVDDLQGADEFPEGKTSAKERGHRTTLAVPLLRRGTAIGSILIRRLEVRPFSTKHIALLQTFADQAVIAIENVRLFTELQEKNQALTEAHATVTESLEQQTATGEILRVISSSPTDVQPVFDAIARSAKELCAAEFSTVFRFDGTLLHLAAHCGWSPAGVDALRRAFPTAPHRRSAGGRAILNGAVEHIPDVYADAEYALGAVG